jgi:hypothetical protein
MITIVNHMTIINHMTTINNTTTINKTEIINRAKGIGRGNGVIFVCVQHTHTDKIFFFHGEQMHTIYGII